jgi:hypothetical protein
LQASNAQPCDILALAFRPGLVLTSLGTVIGLAASLVVTHLMSSLLFAVSAIDPLTFVTHPCAAWHSDGGHLLDPRKARDKHFSRRNAALLM